MKNRTPQVLATITVTSILSLLIGGFAVWGSYQAELSIVDAHINTVALDVAEVQGIRTAALLSVEQITLM